MLTRKIQCNRFRWSTNTNNILVNVKNFWQYNKLTSDKFVKKKIIISQNILYSMPDFSELQCLIDNLVDFLKLSVFTNASLP